MAVIKGVNCIQYDGKGWEALLKKLRAQTRNTVVIVFPDAAGGYVAYVFVDDVLVAAIHIPAGKLEAFLALFAKEDLAASLAGPIYVATNLPDIVLPCPPEVLLQRAGLTLELQKQQGIAEAIAQAVRKR